MVIKVKKLNQIQFFLINIYFLRTRNNNRKLLIYSQFLFENIIHTVIFYCILLYYIYSLVQSVYSLEAFIFTIK